MGWKKIRRLCRKPMGKKSSGWSFKSRGGKFWVEGVSKTTAMSLGEISVAMKDLENSN